MSLFGRRRRQEMQFCFGCRRLWPECAMNWDTIGQYRCRCCNPDPGPVHDSQTRAQRARSARYARAAGAKPPLSQCTECGRKRLRERWHPFRWRLTDPPPAGEVVLCRDCIGPESAHQGWFGMELSSN